ncbi:MAG TPA: hypothetical protein VJL89_02825 [Thermodesulfovibrionia bacterium]|nr:hypothetical protein [Thermodesulfovibrionia bacterium]
MNTIFVDTSALIALVNKRDTFHKQAYSMKQKLVKDRTSFITTNAVILELCNTFSRVEWKSVAVSMVSQINQSERWFCVTVDNFLMKRGFEKFKNMADKIGA